MIKAYACWVRDQIAILLLLAAFVIGCVVPSLWWMQFLAGKSASIGYAGILCGVFYFWIFWCYWIHWFRKVRTRSY